MLPSGRASVDGGTWIDVRDKVTVGPDETKVVPFTITAPAGATPGDHPAGIAATIISTGGTVNVESRVGFRVLLPASGTVRSSLAVGDLAVRYAPSWNPFSAGTIRVRYTVVNAGNVRATGTGRLTVSELFGLAGNDATARVEELLPGGWPDVRVPRRWCPGAGAAAGTLALTPAPLGANLAGAEIRPIRGTVTTWAFPWSQLALLALLGALVVGFRTVVRQRRRRLTRLLARAREEGRAQGRGSAPVGGGPPSSR